MSSAPSSLKGSEDSSENLEDYDFPSIVSKALNPNTLSTDLIGALVSSVEGGHSFPENTSLEIGAVSPNGRSVQLIKLGTRNYKNKPEEWVNANRVRVIATLENEA